MIRGKMQPDLSDALVAARSLLGWKLVHDTPKGRTAGYIVETEAYDMHDPASHSFGGPRPRNSPMYQEAGTIYVYLIYGIHYCVNIVTGAKDQGQAVLIRALEPIEGTKLMKQRRAVAKDHELTNGPAKLVQALGITPKLNGHRLGHTLRLEPGKPVPAITQTTRVGISKAVDHPWRFYITDSPYVSRP